MEVEKRFKIVFSRVLPDLIWVIIAYSFNNKSLLACNIRKVSVTVSSRQILSDTEKKQKCVNICEIYLLLDWYLCISFFRFNILNDEVSTAVKHDVKMSRKKLRRISINSRNFLINHFWQNFTFHTDQNRKFFLVQTNWDSGRQG